MNKIWRNRVALAAGIVAVVLGIFIFQHYGPVAMPREAEPDPIAIGNRLEAAVPGHVDVLFVRAGQYSAYMTNNVLEVAYLWDAKRDEMPYAIRLTPQGWDIVESYQWKPDTGDDNRVYWTRQKQEYYSDNAMFMPGEAARVEEALDYLDTWYARGLTCKWLEAVAREALIAEEVTGEHLSIIILHFLYPTPIKGIGSNGKPQTFAIIQRAGSLWVFRQRVVGEERDGGHVYKIHADVWEDLADGVTRDELGELIQDDAFQVVPVSLWESPLWTNFNHPPKGK